MKNSSISLFGLMFLIFVFSTNGLFAQKQKAGEKHSKIWEGSWQTSWNNGSATMKLYYNNTSVLGTYDFNEGKISAISKKENRMDILEGTWHQSNNSGWFKFTMNQNNDSFTGVWGYSGSLDTISIWNGINSSSMTDIIYEEEGKDFTYDESLMAWEKLKKENGNSYIYKQEFTSWTGYGNITKITVKQGVVVERKYQTTKYSDNGKRSIIKSYTEKGEDVGKHNEGRPAVTLDQVYIDSKKYIEVDKDTHMIIFSTFQNGILKDCGNIPHGCADDCYNGVSISDFTWIK